MTTKHIHNHMRYLKPNLKEHLKFYAQRIPTSFDKQNTTEIKAKYFKDYCKHYGTELTESKMPLNGRFYAEVISVSRSGMSRKIELAYVYKID